MAEPLTTDAERIALAREYFPFYMGWLHKTDMPTLFDGQAVPFAHHLKMIDVLVDDSLGDTLIVAPRGSSKTTLAQGWLEWIIGRASLTGDPAWMRRLRVIYIRNTFPDASDVSVAIKNIIEFNEIYHAIFPAVKPFKDRWNQERWQLAGNEEEQNPNFIAAGIGSPPLGKRGTVVLLDDTGDKENMKTPAQRADVRHTLNHTIRPMRVPGGRFVMLCTRWAWDDPAQWAMDLGWHTLYMKALTVNPDTEEEESYWPERFSVEYLHAERGDTQETQRAFAQQYQNEVVPEEGLIFERIWFLDRFDVPPSEIILKVDSWDTASGQGRKRSYSAGLSALVSADWHIYILNLLRGQLPYPDLREAVRLTAQRNKSNAVIIEAKSSGHALVQDDRLRGLPIVEWQPFGQKGSPTRAEANMRISSVCAQLRVHLPSDFFCRRVGSEGWLADFEQEVFSYPEGEHDDIVDAFCQLLFWVEDQRLRHQHFLAQPQEPMRWGKGRSGKVLV
jgi:predicted phage terminase large subunit-like protein